MVKILKKKFFEIDIPILNEKCEAQAHTIQELNNKTIRYDATRKLRGKSVDLILNVVIEDNKATTIPKKMTLLPFFIKHMLHGGISYVEDSFRTNSADHEIIIKPFMITRKKVSRAVKNTLRNSTKNWLIDYAKTKSSEELFMDILSGQLQKALSLKLKKIYPLAICEIRVLEIKKALVEKKDKIETKIVKEEKVEEIEVQEEETKEIEAEKPKEKKSRKTKTK